MAGLGFRRGFCNVSDLSHCFWLLVTLIAPALNLYDSKLVNLGRGDAKQLETIARQLGEVRGVIEVSLISDEAVAYLKIDPDNVDAEKLEALTG